MAKQYCYSWDNKSYDNGTFNSIKEAFDDACNEALEHQADEGLNPDSVYIAEAKPYQNRAFYPDADAIAEYMAGSAYDKGGEHAEGYPDFDKDAESELTQMLYEVLDKWCAKHEISPTFYQVGDTVKYSLETSNSVSGSCAGHEEEE